MLQTEVLEKFRKLIPSYAEYMTEWFPNGQDSIRVRCMYGRDYIFTYHAPHNWRFETVDCFIDEMEGEK